MQIAIIGAGNMGGAIIRGLLKHGTDNNLLVADIAQLPLDELKQLSPTISVSLSAKEIVPKADIVIVAVKPWLVEAVLEDIAPMLRRDQLLISIAAGVDFECLAKLTDNPEVQLFRVIPNTAIEHGESMTLVASFNASKEGENTVLGLFNQLGKAVLIDENLMTAATSVASCGVAYALRYLRAAVAGAVELGFRADVATQIVAQTMKGAVSLVEGGAHPEVEIDKVCTPGGWTVKGLNEMEAHGFTNSVIKGLKANS
ncbi:MAG: pyrroline-5-carboxylate reductase [Prevotellaceae bacterium]|jgi:pyrroline-5-carboxylate reductase|nr:pyrroline-5-carboxylate reductase [Prevotellaceae bacterium]